MTKKRASEVSLERLRRMALEANKPIPYYFLSGRGTIVKVLMLPNGLSDENGTIYDAIGYHPRYLNYWDAYAYSLLHS